MTLEQFRATGRHVDSLAKAIVGDAIAGDDPGIVYHGDLWIEERGDGYCLTIGNMQREDAELSVLEEVLYDWGVSEGIIE